MTNPISPREALDALAIEATVILAKHGINNPDWTEWRDLKNTLAAILPHITNRETRAFAGRMCSRFDEQRRKAEH